MPGKPCVTMGALLQCSFGLAPASLIVPPVSRVTVEGKPVAVLTNSTIVNIPTFGMCSSLANPTVAAATAAALGVLTPMPCVPVPTPWVPGAPLTRVGGLPVVTVGSMAVCAFGGAISITMPGSFRTTAS